jgi:hypothetical protein
MALVHAVLARLLRTVSVGPQAAALGGVGAGNVVCIVPALLLAAGPWGLVYVLLLYNSLAFCYFLISNTSETSLHVHMIMEILLAGEISRTELASRYSADHMIEARIGRMVAVGQLVERGGAYFSNGLAVVRLGAVYDLWRRILAMPRSPEEAFDHRKKKA